jgi:hypothetical protein
VVVKSWQLLEDTLGVESKEIVQMEFDVFAKLSFSLFVDPKEVVSHSLRLQTNLEITSKFEKSPEGNK